MPNYKAAISFQLVKTCLQCIVYTTVLLKKEIKKQADVVCLLIWATLAV